MEWINIEIKTLEQPEFRRVKPAIGWTWIRLLAYCHRNENGGKIVAAKHWRKRDWIICVGISQKSISSGSLLWRWEGDDLIVKGYPVQKEREVIAKRLGGVKGSKSRWGHLAEPLTKPMNESVTESVTDPVAESKAELIRNRKGIGIGIGREGEGDALADSIPSLEEVRTWASGPVGVDPAYAEKKWHDTNERHGWVANGRLIDWKHRWKRFWEEDRGAWFHQKAKNGTPPAGHGSDPAWWWTDDLETLERTLIGATLAGRAELVEQLRAVLEARRGGAR